MTPAELLDRVDVVLQEERTALTSLDARKVEELASEKQTLFAQLAECGLGAEHLDRMRAVYEGLRRNLVLLAGARDCVKDALFAARGNPRGPGRALSVRG